MSLKINCFRFLSNKMILKIILERLVALEDCLTATLTSYSWLCYHVEIWPGDDCGEDAFLDQAMIEAIIYDARLKIN